MFQRDWKSKKLEILDISWIESESASKLYISTIDYQAKLVELKIEKYNNEYYHKGKKIWKSTRVVFIFRKSTSWAKLIHTKNRLAIGFKYIYI